MTTVLDQLPRLSKYDPGVTGEGGLDPLGFASVADRIADRIAPGVRARMSNPRFVTLSAVGAIVCQDLHGSVGPEGTTPDLAFEWVVVEALVRHTPPEQRIGLPGSGKAAAARAQNKRLGPGQYLRGPRVFGFTGVYRPFSLDSHVLQPDGLVGPAGEELVAAWAADQGLKGFGVSASGSGATLAHELASIVAKSLQQEQSTLPPTGAVATAVATHLAPRGARARERRNLRMLVTSRRSADSTGQEIRDEVAKALTEMTVTQGLTERELTSALFQRTARTTRLTLRAAYDFEECVTAIDHAFRMMLGQATAQHNSFLDPARAQALQPLVDVGPRLGRLCDAAVGSATALDDVLGREVEDCLQRFASNLTPAAFMQALLARHEEVQAAKGKLMWLDDIAGGYAIRPPFQNQSIDMDAAFWTHPMRLHALATFLRETA